MLLNAAARQAAALQRATFFKMLRVPEVLAPVDASAISEEELSAAHDSALRTIEAEADAIIERHTPNLPEGAGELRQLWSAPAWPAEDRAAAHLQMASLALSAQRVLLTSAQADDRYLLANALKVRGVVASALGVVAVGEAITVPPVTWLPNKLALVFSGAQFLQARRRPVIERLLQRFVDDLGPTFEVEASDPSPSLRLTRCFYHDFFEAEGEPLLAPLFTAQHGGTFEGVPGYSFEDDGDGRCRFLFEGVPP